MSTSENSAQNSSFISKLIKSIFPVEKKDAEKVFIIFFLFFFISFIYNIIQPLKKTIMMYTPGAGTEAMPYLKPLAIVPGSVLLTWYYLKLSAHFNRDTVFRVIIMTFTAYFILYTFVLNPFKDFFALDTIADGLLYALPKNFHAMPSLIRYWMHTLFYAFAELWGATVLSLLLWGLVNEISTQDEAKATYALFSVGANSSGIFAGKLSSFLSKLPFNPNFPYGSSQWDQSFLRIMLVVIAASCAILMVYRHFVKKGYTSKIAFAPPVQVEGEKQKISVFDCFKEVFKSKNLLYITIIVMSYNLVYNLSDIVFNKRVELTFGPENKVASNAFMSYVQMYTGVISTILALVISNFALKRFGWTFTALITPVAYFLSGAIFYAAQIHGLSEHFAFFAIDPSMLALYAGGMHICFTRGSKYSVFDATKEMAYIGLTPQERSNGKAAIDGVASRFGKSGGSMIMLFLYAFMGNDIIKLIPYVFVMVGIITILWMLAVRNLGRYYDKRQENEIVTSILDNNPA